MSWSDILVAACGQDEPPVRALDAALREDERELTEEQISFALRWVAEALSRRTLAPAQYAAGRQKLGSIIRNGSTRHWSSGLRSTCCRRSSRGRRS
jgi:hypothetical protein